MTFLTIEYMYTYRLLDKHFQLVKHTIVDKIGTTSTYNTYAQSIWLVTLYILLYECTCNVSIEVNYGMSFHACPILLTSNSKAIENR